MPIRKSVAMPGVPAPGSELFAMLKKLGFMEVPKPDVTMPVLPKDLAVLSSVQMSKIMTHYAAWREYSESLYSRASVAAAYMQETYDFEYSKLYVSLSGKPTERKEAVAADEPLYKKRLQLLEANMYCEMLSKQVESFNSAWTALSREITLRDRDNNRR